MDRQFVYDGALTQTVDILQTNKFAMIGLSFALRAALGNGTVVHGLAIAPGGGMTVTINAGSIYALDNVDGTAYGDLGSDFNTILKQGILYSPLTLTIPNTLPSGFSQVFLVQAQLTDIDTGNVVLPYFNANNPNQPFSGPNNSGISQFSIRSVVATISLVAGVAAPTGSQTTPNAQTNNVGLYTITISNSTVTITTGLIATLPTAPFFPNLPSIPGDVQSNLWTYAPDTSVAANSIIATLAPPVTALTPGLIAIVKVANTNTGATTLNLNGLGAVAVHRSGGAALSAGDITAGAVCAFMYDGTAWQLLNYNGATSGSVTNNTFSSNIPYGTDVGSANAIACTSLFQSGTQIAGAITAAGSISTASATITMPNVSGFPWVTAGMSVYDNTNGQPIGTVQTWVGTTLTLTANALHNGSGSTDSLVFTSIGALVAGLAIAVDVANNNTGATTLALPGISGTTAIQENKAALLPNGVVASQVSLFIYDGTVFQKMNARWPYQLFDEASPPASDIPMQVGDQTTITFENVTNIPLKVATPSGGGVFSIEMVVTSNNATHTDVYLNPNNTTFSALFKDWVQINSDAGVTSAPYLVSTAQAQSNLGAGGGIGVNPFTSFVFNLFVGPNANDVTNNIGPFFLSAIVSTFTTGKMARFNGGIAGGPVAGFELWNDTSTAWTSLGTMAVAKTGNPSGGYGSATLATVSGVIVIKRLA